MAPRHNGLICHYRLAFVSPRRNALMPFLLPLRFIFIKEANGHSSQWYQVDRKSSPWKLFWSDKELSEDAEGE
jgi:hypothetical protein